MTEDQILQFIYDRAVEYGNASKPDKSVALYDLHGSLAQKMIEARLS